MSIIIIIIITPPASPRAHTMGRTREVTLSSPSARLPALQAPYGNLAPSEKEQILQHPLSTPSKANCEEQDRHQSLPVHPKIQDMNQ